MTEMIELAEFRRLARRGAPPRGGVSALSARAVGPVDDRIIRFVFSDGERDRAGDTIDPNGWQTAAYLRNPVVLWAHDALAPPIGRTVNLFVDPLRGLVGDVEFAAPEVFEFADQIYRLVREGFIKAGSVGFLPIDYSFRDRPFGIDFHRQELLEFSIVPVPANANALIEAQAKRLITAREAGSLRSRFEQSTGADIEARRRRLAALDLRNRRAPAEQRLPPRAMLQLQFAGTLEDRERQVDLAYPGLRRQEADDARAALRQRHTYENQRALLVALGRLGETY